MAIVICVASFLSAFILPPSTMSMAGAFILGVIVGRIALVTLGMKASVLLRWPHLPLVLGAGAVAAFVTAENQARFGYGIGT